MKRKIVVPKLKVTEVCDAKSPSAMRRIVPSVNGRPEVIYYIREAGSSELDERNCERVVRHEYNFFPVVLDKSGAPWDVANLYVLSRLEGITIPVMATYAGFAEDLAAYLQFIEEQGLDFTVFPSRKLHRPTYRYNGDLKLRMQAGELARTTAKRRISTVISFYRWLKGEGLLVPEHPPWKEGDRYIGFKDAQGFSVSKKVITTDISIKTNVQKDPYDETIDDGGKLRPLPSNEQEWLINALLSLGNTEMTLIHLMALLTGARMQTVLTMRVRHAQLELPEGLRELRFAVGPETGIDTKGDKNMSIFFPVWFYEKLQTYSMSERAIKRRQRADGGDTENQYLFLSQQGKPFYQSKADAAHFDDDNSLRHTKAGQGVRQFIKERIIPFIRKEYEPGYHYRPHDLRATFGMNLTDAQLALVQQGKITLHQAREFVKIRMGHSSSAMTDRYLNHRKSLVHIRTAVAEYEQHLKQLAERAMDALL